MKAPSVCMCKQLLLSLCSEGSDRAGHLKFGIDLKYVFVSKQLLLINRLFVLKVGAESS